MAKRRPARGRGLPDVPDRPLIALLRVENGEEVVRCFADAVEAAVAIAPHEVAEALTLAGAGADLD